MTGSDHRQGDRRPRRVATALAVLLASVALVSVGLSACASDDLDRPAAVERVLTRYDGRLTRPQAECYVDRVADELGAAALDNESPAPEQVPRLTRIRIDCAGVASLGTSRPAATRGPTAGGGTAPLRVGANPELDALHAACAGGSGSACDQLFDRAPLGSEYEEFALTCGQRTTEARCADRYPDPEPQIK